MKINWNYPTSVWVGENRINDLFIGCETLKIKKPLFVTDKDLVDLPMVKNFFSKFKQSFEKYPFILKISAQSRAFP